MFVKSIMPTKLGGPKLGLVHNSSTVLQFISLSLGTTGKEGIEIEFRGELENLICSMFKNVL